MENHSLQSTLQPTIAQLLCPSVPAKWRATVLVAVGVMLLTASAKIQIPFYPVPQTLQTMVVLLLGMAYGARLAIATVSLYLLVGALGMAVFAGTPEKGIGLAYMFGPTGGYLLGFIIAAWFCGKMTRYHEKSWQVLLVMMGGNAIIYACGLLWLGSVVGWDKPILSLGMYPFLLGDALKIAFAAAALPPLVRMLRK